MEAAYWQNAWSENRIGFHQQNINKRLQQHWPDLNLPDNCPVFVPLCGKSQDLLWLHAQGHPITGVELSSEAIQSFFIENNLPYTHKKEEDFEVFNGADIAEGITLLAGDFFKLTPEHLEHCRAFYDRASLIAMPPAMRADYAAHMGRLMHSDSRGLLIAIEYDQSRMKGPPFSVSDDNVHELMSHTFDISELACFSGPERLGNLAKRGLETLEERIYLLTGHPSHVIIESKNHA